MPATPSRFIWYELMTDNAVAAIDFYGIVVGWTTRDSGLPEVDYRILSIDHVSIGGIMNIPADAAAAGMRPCWLGYLNVDDVDTAVADTTAAGGTVPMPATEIPSVGRMAMITDPQGAAIYVMTPSGEGSSVAFAPGRPGHGGWNELRTTDWQGAFAFYAARFGWQKVREMDMGSMGTYLIFGAGGDDAIGGMMTNPNIPRPAWLYYFNVDNIDTAWHRVTKSGGAVLNGPQEVPGGLWVLQARDPQGAAFALVGPRYS